MESTSNPSSSRLVVTALAADAVARFNGALYGAAGLAGAVGDGAVVMFLCAACLVEAVDVGVVVVAIQQNTYILVGETRTRIDLPIRSMICFRGDMPHAGGGYQEDHYRIFVSVSSTSCAVTGEVHLVL